MTDPANPSESTDGTVTNSVEGTDKPADAASGDGQPGQDGSQAATGEASGAAGGNGEAPEAAGRTPSSSGTDATAGSKPSGTPTTLDVAVRKTQKPAGSGVGIAFVGPFPVALLTVFFVVESVLLIYAAIALWPVPDPDNAGKYLPNFFLGQQVNIDIDRSYFLVVALSGAIGAMLYVMRSFYEYVGERQLRWSWVPSYIVQPVVGGVLASIMYVILRAGLLSGPVSQTGNAFGFAAIAALVGLFSKQANKKLKQVFETLLAQDDGGSDSLKQVSETVISQDESSGADIELSLTFNPSSGVPTADVAISGTGLEGVTSVTFGGDATAAAAYDVTGGVLRTKVPELAKTGPISVNTGTKTLQSAVDFTVEPSA